MRRGRHNLHVFLREVSCKKERYCSKKERRKKEVSAEYNNGKTKPMEPGLAREGGRRFKGGEKAEKRRWTNVPLRVCGERRGHNFVGDERTDLQSMKVFQDEDATRLAVSTVPPITTSFCKELNMTTGVKRRQPQRTMVSDNAPTGDTRLLKRSIFVGKFDAVVERAEGGEKEAREQIESRRFLYTATKGRRGRERLIQGQMNVCEWVEIHVMTRITHALFLC